MIYVNLYPMSYIILIYLYLMEYCNHIIKILLRIYGKSNWDRSVQIMFVVFWIFIKRQHVHPFIYLLNAF